MSHGLGTASHRLSAKKSCKSDFPPLLLLAFSLQRDLRIAGFHRRVLDVAEGELGHGADQGGEASSEPLAQVTAEEQVVLALVVHSSMSLKS